MRLLVTGSAGHLGEALVRVLSDDGHEVVGLDVLASPYTSVVGSIADRAVLRECVRGVDAILHAATLHKPHVGSHGRREFVDTNITGTLNLLEEAVAAGVSRFVFTSTTSAFGRALIAASGARPRRGSPRASRTSRATSTARRRPPPGTSASSSTATTACPA